MNSIYIESKTLLENKPAVEWLDKCGAKWLMGEKFLEWHPQSSDKYIFFARNTNLYSFTCYGKSDSTHTSTALQFCQGVARILGIPEPTFGDDKDKAFWDSEQAVIDRAKDNPMVIDPALYGAKVEPPIYPHKTYRILDSLDGIPLDTRIPLSEWIPPFGADVLFIFDEIDTPFFTHINALTKSGLRFNNTFISNAWKHFGGHWMRIV